MTRLKDVMDVELLKEMIDGGFVTEREHPEESLVIFNYTDKATYANAWNEVTLNCRGLITDLHDLIVARGMPKFFNHNQPEAPEFRPDDMVDVSDKADGSLGILYRLPSTGEWAVATRGSFVSEQAIWATEKLRTMLEDSPGLATFLKTASLAQMTPVVEIVYPENRIVLDYGDTEDLVLLGAVENQAGRFWPVRTAPEWPSKTAEHLEVTSFAGALALPNRENREGLVLTRVSDGTMLKIKQQDYVEKHRAVFGLNARRVWEMLVEAPDRVDEWIAALPDEFQQWARDKAMELELEVDVKTGWVHWYFDETCDDLNHLHGDDWGRKEFAAEVKGHEYQSELFALLSGRDVEPMLWKKVKPSHLDKP